VTRERKAQIVTLAVLTGVLTLVVAAHLGRQRAGVPLSNWFAGTRKPAASPQDTIYRMMDAARDGDVTGYVACYTGQTESALRQIVREKGERSLADYIRAFNSAVKGIAIQEPQFVSEREARLHVEYIYSDRNEVQIYHLQKFNRDWKISQQGNAVGTQALVPYGAPVE